MLPTQINYYADVYAMTNALTPEQNEKIILLALMLFVTGLLLIEGAILDKTYHYIRRLIGIPTESQTDNKYIRI